MVFFPSLRSLAPVSTKENPTDPLPPLVPCCSKHEPVYGWADADRQRGTTPGLGVPLLNTFRGAGPQEGAQLQSLAAEAQVRQRTEPLIRNIG